MIIFSVSGSIPCRYYKNPKPILFAKLHTNQNTCKHNNMLNESPIKTAKVIYGNYSMFASRENKIYL